MRQQQRPLLHGAKFESFTGTCKKPNILWGIVDFYLLQDDSGLSYLGPYGDIWESVCLHEFGYDVIHRINKAQKEGFLTINKFWAFENYNYMVFGTKADNNNQQVESRYLSSGAFALEVSLAVAMAAVCVVTVFGNAAVFAAILVDPITKKSVYQYFQMGLCLADILMGVAGAGGIVYTQVLHFVFPFSCCYRAFVRFLLPACLHGVCNVRSCHYGLFLVVAQTICPLAVCPLVRLRQHLRLHRG